MNQQTITTFFTQRRAALEALKPQLSPNFFELVGEKINQEEEALLMILHGEVRKEKVLEQFSFILDERYFEQKLMH